MAFATLAGCVLENEQPAISEKSDEVWNGVATFPFSNRTVQLPGCTGTLIQNDWILTAAHCIGNGKQLPANYQATFSTESRLVDRVVYHPGSGRWPDTSTDVDVAMLHLQQPFSLQPTTWEPLMFNGDTDDLIGETVQCYGYGAQSAYGSCTMSSQCNSGDWCQYGKCLVPSTNLRTASFTVKADPSNPDLYFQLDVPNANGQMLLPGDSGGACYLYGTQHLVGVLKAGNTSNYNRENSAEAFGSWVNQKRNCNIYDPTNVNWSLCSPGCPCDVGEGDCDSNNDCRAGLRCAHNVGAKYGLNATLDVCEAPSTCPQFDPSNPDAELCGTPGCPCSYLEGDCDGDFECGGSMICRQDVGAAVNLGSNWDVCTYPPRTGCPVYDTNAPNSEQCTPDCPCGPGEGDCDTNDDCLPGLSCANKDQGPAFGLPSNYDVCVKTPKRVIIRF